MATAIAELFVKVSGDVSDAINGLTSVDQKVNGTSASMAAAAPAGYALAGAATAVGAGFLSAINVASDFEHQISGIKSVMSPAEVQEFGGAIESLALALGKDTPFSASQAADAIETLIKAGVPLPAILGGAAKSALDLALATGTDVTVAAELASTAMNAFHLSADKLPDIMDTISNVSNATATSVDKLKLGLAAVGPVAAGIGISFTDTATALGIFANNGLQGSDAGTSLKTMLLNLEPSTKAQTAVFKELGLITADGANQFFDATGKAKPLNEIFEILKQSTSNLTLEQKANALQTAFGTDAVRAALIAANEGAAGWDNVTEAMAKMGGTQVAAEQRNQGLAGSMKQLGGSFETIQIQVGSLFLPVLTKLADMLTGLLNGFLSLDDGTKTTIIAIVGIAGAAAGLLAGFILLGPVIGAVGAAFGIIAAAAGAVALPIVALVAAGAALYLAWQTNFGGIRDVTQQVWDAIQPAFVNIANFIDTARTTLAPVFENLKTAIAPLLPVLSDLVGNYLALIPAEVRILGDAFNFLGEWIGFAFEKIQELIQTPEAQAFFAGLGAVLSVVATSFTTFLGVVRTTFTSIAGIVSGLGDPWASFVDGAWAIGTRIGQAFGNFLGFIKTAIQGIPNTLGGLGDLWKPFIDGAWNIGTRIGDAFANFLSFIGTALHGIPNLITGLGDFWKPFIDSAWNIGTHLGDAFANFLGFIGTALSGIPSMLSKLPDLWEPFITSAWNIGTHIGDAFGNFLGFIGNSLRGIPDLLSKLPDLWKPFIDSAWNIGTDLGNAFGNFLKFIGDALRGIPTLITSLDIFGGIIEQAKAIFAGISNAIDPIRQLIASTFGNIMSWVGSGGTAGTGGGGGGQPASPAPVTGGGSGGSIVVNVTIGSISSEAEKDSFLAAVAAAILASAQRVTPPVSGWNPVLG